MPTTKPLPLDVLPTFAAVADAGSMRAAGEALHLTHSAISQQIRLLEERLGFAVFARQGRGLALTPAGQRLLDASRGALAMLAEARQEAARLALDAQRPQAQGCGRHRRRQPAPGHDGRSRCAIAQRRAVGRIRLRRLRQVRARLRQQGRGARRALMWL